MSSASIFQWQQFLSDVIINWLSTTTEDKCCTRTGTWLKHCHPFARPLSLLMNICTTYADKLRGGIYLSNVSAIECITWNRKINPYTTSAEDCAVVAQGADPADLSFQNARPLYCIRLAFSFTSNCERPKQKQAHVRKTYSQVSHPPFKNLYIASVLSGKSEEAMKEGISYALRFVSPWKL